MKVNYGLIVIDPTVKNGKIYHFCGYEKPPTGTDVESLRKELETNPEFGLQPLMGRLSIISADNEVMENYFEIIEDIENG